MTPNNQVKAKLFALYVFQTVLIDPHNPFVKPNYLIPADFDFRINLKFNDYSLLLRSIESLKDEELAILASYSAYRLTDKNISKVGIAMARHLFELNKWSGNTILTMTDYLRSIGIALPITYLDENHKPVTASVSELVEWGWVKIVEK